MNQSETDGPRALSDAEIDAIAGALSITDVPKALKAIGDAIAAGVNVVARELTKEPFHCC
jgi:hypothetical protein